LGLTTDAANDPGTRRRITEPLSGAVWLTTCVLVAGIPVPLLLVVCGVLTLARIIRIGAQMHEDLAGTV